MIFKSTKNWEYHCHHPTNIHLVIAVANPVCDLWRLHAVLKVASLWARRCFAAYLGLRFGVNISFSFNLALGCYIRDGKWSFHTFGMRFRRCLIVKWDRCAVTVVVLCGVCRLPFWQVFHTSCGVKVDRTCFCSRCRWYICGMEILCQIQVEGKFPSRTRRFVL